MFSQERLDAVQVWTMERLGISGSWKVQNLTAGFSRCVLWHIIPEKGPELVVRVVERAQFERLDRAYQVLEQAWSRDLPVNEPLLCEVIEDECVVMATRYIEGEDGGHILQGLEEFELEESGRAAGLLLRGIHALPAKDNTVTDWARRRILEYERNQAAAYDEQLSFAAQDRVEDFLEERLGTLARATIGLQHDGFHPQNMIFKDRRLAGIIGFENCDSGDPIEDFSKVPWFTVPLSETFARSQIDAYLDGYPVDRFWERYNIAVAMSLSSSLVWAHRNYTRQRVFQYQHRIMEVVNTHDFTDGGPPSWY
ncbi:MAG: phosphotransferase family protein [Opitutales bacterium]